MIFIAEDLCTSIQNKFSPIENEKVIELKNRTKIFKNLISGMALHFNWLWNKSLKKLKVKNK